VKRNSQKIQPKNQRRLEIIGRMLKEIRFSKGRNQDEYVDLGVKRRQIQRGEYGSNLTLNSLFSLLDCYGYSLNEFFKELE
jgi:transcriptional regulator with XRE-family HTH domain